MGSSNSKMQVESETFVMQNGMIDFQVLLNLWGKWWVQAENRRGKFLGVYYQGDWPTVRDGKQHRLHPNIHKLSFTNPAIQLTADDYKFSENLIEEIPVSESDFIDNLSQENQIQIFTKEIKWCRTAEVTLTQMIAPLTGCQKLTLPGLFNPFAILCQNFNLSATMNLEEKSRASQEVSCTADSRSTLQYVVKARPVVASFKTSLFISGEVVVCCKNKVKQSKDESSHRKWNIPIQTVFQDFKNHPEILTDVQREKLHFFEIRQDGIVFMQEGHIKTQHPIELALRPMQVESLSTVFERLMQEGEANEDETATQVYTNALKIRPQSARAYAERGRVYYSHLQDYEKAKLDLVHATQLDPKETRAYFWLGFLYSKQTSIYKRQSDALAAIHSFTRCIELGEEDYQGGLILIYEVRGHLYLFLNEPLNAIEDYNKLISLGHEGIYFKRGEAYLMLADSVGSLTNKRERLLLAKADFQKQLDISSENSDENTRHIKVITIELDNINLEEEALRCLSAKQYDRVLQLTTQIIKNNSQYPNAYYLQGVAFFHLNQFQKAHQSLKLALNLRTAFQQEYGFCYYHACILAALKDYQPALKGFIHVKTICSKILNDPEYDYHYWLAYSYHGVKENYKALENINLFLVNRPHYANAHCLKGNILRTLGQYQQAASCYTLAIEDGEQASYTHRATLYVLLGDQSKENNEKERYYGLAISDIDQYIHLTPNGRSSVQGIYDRTKLKLENLHLEAEGIRLFHADEYLKSLELFERIIKTDNQYVYAYYYRGLNLYHLGRYQESLKNLNEAVKRKPEFQQTITFLEYRTAVLYCLKDYKGSLKDLEEFNSLELPLSKKRHYFYWKAEVLYHLKRYDESLECANQAIVAGQELSHIACGLVYTAKAEETENSIAKRRFYEKAKESLACVAHVRIESQSQRIASLSRNIENALSILDLEEKCKNALQSKQYQKLLSASNHILQLKSAHKLALYWGSCANYYLSNHRQALSQASQAIQLGVTEAYFIRWQVYYHMARAGSDEEVNYNLAVRDLKAYCGVSRYDQDTQELFQAFFYLDKITRKLCEIKTARALEEKLEQKRLRQEYLARLEEERERERRENLARWEKEEEERKEARWREESLQVTRDLAELREREWAAKREALEKIKERKREFERDARRAGEYLSVTDGSTITTEYGAGLYQGAQNTVRESEREISALESKERDLERELGHRPGCSIM